MPGSSMAAFEWGGEREVPERRRSLDRVCRKGGRIIILTYMSRTERGTTNRVSSAIGKAVRISSGNLR